MTVFQKINHIRQECYPDLNDWESEFIDDISEGVKGLPDSTSDQEIAEYLTRRQIEKVNEIWEDLGL